MNAEINTAQTRRLSWLRGNFLGNCVALGRWELEHPSRIVKNFGQKSPLFSMMPKNRTEILDFHRIFLRDWTYLSFFPVYAQKLQEFWA